MPQIVAALEDEIVSGRWSHGLRIPSERVLADRFRVARSVVREALRALQERQLIVPSAGRGSFVRELSAAAGIGNAEHLARSGRVSVTDLILARAALEPVAAELAATARTEADLAMLRHVHDRFAGADAMEAANVDLDFHTAIMVASHNLVLQVMFAAIRPLAHAMMARSLSDPRVVGADLHGVLVERIAAGDAAGARAAMVQHIEAARMFYGSDLDRSLAEVLQARADVEPGFAAILRELTTDHAALHPRPDPKTPVTAPAPPRS